MSSIVASPPIQAPAARDRDAAFQADHDHEPAPSRLWVLLEALAYAGAAVDPSAALAAQRFVRIRDQERRRAAGDGG